MRVCLHVKRAEKNLGTRGVWPSINLFIGNTDVIYLFLIVKISVLWENNVFGEVFKESHNFSVSFGTVMRLIIFLV